MMAGRNKQPINLVIAKGKKHLTKEEINNRKSNEIKAPSDKIRAPSYLNKDLKREFNKIAKQLKGIDIMTNLDVDALASFIIARKLYLEATQKLIENPDTILDKDLVGVQDKFFKQCRATAGDLGLTISSRCKLIVPTKEDNKPQNKFSKFM